MARPYSVNITNGEGTSNILSGSYAVTSSTNGYNDASIDPYSITIDKTTGEYLFEIAANGILTFHVSEEGTIGGTPIIGATFVRCDLNGTEYGNQVTTDSFGTVSLFNVPYAESNSPRVYFKQLNSDGEHEYDNTLKNQILTLNSTTLEIQNPLPLSRTLKLTDANYNGLKIDTSTITLT